MGGEGLHWIDLVISAVLALIMFGIGLSLNFSSFKEIGKHPKLLIIGLLVQMVGLPLIAFGIGWLADLPPAMKVGLIILAACPGGTTSGFVTYLFKGNVALSISLTSVNAFLALLTIPFVVNLGLQSFMGTTTEFHLPFLETSSQIFLVTIFPAFLGVFIRTKAEKFALKIEPYIKVVMIVLLALVYLVKFLADENSGGTGISSAEFMDILPYAFLFNVVCSIFGFFAGTMTGLGVRNAFTIAVEVTLHNTTLALLVAGSLLQNQDMVKPALVYTMFSFWSALVFGVGVKLLYRTKVFGEFKS